MSHQPGIRLVFRAAPDANTSPALIGDVARSVTAGLRTANQRIEPVYDGTRGGDIYNWLIAVAGTGEDLLTVTSLIVAFIQLLSEVRKSSEKAKIVVIEIHHRADKIPVPLDSDQALLERLLRERLPEKLDPAQTTIEVQVAPPSDTP